MKQTSEQLQSFPTDKVLISKHNTRQPTEKEVTASGLVESIQTQGQLTPGLGRPHPTKKDHIELAAGACRLVACKKLGIPINLVVRSMTDAELLDAILTENLQRTDPDPMQEAILIERRLAEGVPASEIAARYGRTVTWINRRMKLKGLTPNARIAWGEGCAFSHFNTEMMEYIATLAPAVQNDLSDDTYGMREYGTLKELIDGLNSDAISLDGVTWLNDPISFIDGCGPGCSSNSAESLFPDPDHPCGMCHNPDCFRKREAKVTDANIEKIIGDKKLTDFVLFKTDGYGSTILYQNKTVNCLPEWQFKGAYSIVKKEAPDTILGLDVTDQAVPVIRHLKRKDTGSKKGNTMSSSTPPGKKESRESKLTGKRLAELNKQLVAHVKESTIPDSPPILHIVAAFGMNAFRNSCMGMSSHNLAWDSLDSTSNIVSGFDSYGGNGKKNTRETVLWNCVTPLLVGRLIFLKNSELQDAHKRKEMTRIAQLTSFDEEAAWETICTKTIPVPKSWGPGIDAITLEKIKPTLAQAFAKPVTEAKPAKKSAKASAATKAVKETKAAKPAGKTTLHKFPKKTAKKKAS